MIQPYQKDQALLHDIKQASGDHSKFHIWWLGQSGYLLKYANRHVLLDPYLSDSLTIKYANTDKPHIRMTELPIRPDLLNFIDIVSSSHNHTDHLDAETLIPLQRVNPDLKMIIPEANRSFVAKRIQCDEEYPIGLNEGESVQIGQFKFIGIPAAHNELQRNKLGQCLYMGYVIQFGPWTIYHSGDTLWRQEILDALASYEIDLAILPINGNKPERRVAGNLSAKEAVQFAQKMKASMLFPCHYDMFTFNTEDPQLFIQEAQQAGQPYHVLTCGQKWSSPAAIH